MCSGQENTYDIRANCTAKLFLGNNERFNNFRDFSCRIRFALLDFASTSLDMWSRVWFGLNDLRQKPISVVGKRNFSAGNWKNKVGNFTIQPSGFNTSCGFFNAFPVSSFQLTGFNAQLDISELDNFFLISSINFPALSTQSKATGQSNRTVTNIQVINIVDVSKFFIVHSSLYNKKKQQSKNTMLPALLKVSQVSQSSCHYSKIPFGALLLSVRKG